MSAPGPAELARARAEAAAQEREEILRIIERYARQLAYGHGATGAQVLEQIMDEVDRRGRPSV